MNISKSVINRNQTLDVLKFMASFAVVCIHYMFFGVSGEIVRAISRFAVPFFFAISGYFAYYDDSQKTQRKVKHIFALYVSSFLLYFIYSLFKCILVGQTLEEYILMYVNKTTIIDFLVLNSTISSAHLWFLPALIYCYLLNLLLNKRIPEKIIFLVSFVLMVSYLVIEEVLPIFKIDIPKYIYGNVLFRAYPCFMLGMFIRKHKSFIKKRVTKQMVWLTIILGLIETVVSVILWGNSITYFGSMIITIDLLLLAILYENNTYCGFLVKTSSFNMYIYIFHVAVGGVLQTILDYIGFGDEIVWINSKPIIVFVLSIILSYLIDYTRKSTSKRKVD